MPWKGFNNTHVFITGTTNEMWNSRLISELKLYIHFHQFPSVEKINLAEMMMMDLPFIFGPPLILFLCRKFHSIFSLHFFLSTESINGLHTKHLWCFVLRNEQDHASRERWRHHLSPRVMGVRLNGPVLHEAPLTPLLVLFKKGAKCHCPSHQKTFIHPV